MNIFVLCTGRCGSLTLAKACSHITNFSAANDSRALLIGKERLAYPSNHIEIDNRLVWFLGRREEKYGDDAFYVHLMREKEGTAVSHNKRWENEKSIIRAYGKGILMSDHCNVEICRDFYETVNANIAAFLRGKRLKMVFRMENAVADFSKFWAVIGAEGDLESAIREWAVKYNSSQPSSPPANAQKKIIDFGGGQSSGKKEKLQAPKTLPIQSHLKSFPSEIVKFNIEAKSCSYQVVVPKNEFFRVKAIFQEREYAIIGLRRNRGPFIVLDVGANVGLFAIFMKISQTGSIIHCFEPFPAVQALLADNVNKIPGVHIHHYGLFNSDSRVGMNIHKFNTGQNSIKLNSSNHTGTVPVELRHAGKVFDKLGLTSVDVLKIDTEGCETEILEALGPRLQQIDYILLEYHSEDDRRTIEMMLNGFTLFASKSSMIGCGTVKYINNSLLKEGNAQAQNRSIGC